MTGFSEFSEEQQAEARRDYAEMQAVSRADRLARWEAMVGPRWAGRARLDSVEGENRALLRRWVIERSQRNVLLLGTVGTGKTFAALAAARERFLADESVVVRKVLRLLRELRPGGAAETDPELFDRYAAADVLVLDDVGAEKVSEWTVEQMHLLVDERWDAGRPTVVTANYDLDGLRRRLDERLVSRLTDEAVILWFGGPDRRGGGR